MSENIVSNANKEFKWYNSYSLPIELQCNISRLEFPEGYDAPQDLNLSLSSYIVCNQISMHQPALSTTISFYNETKNQIFWDQIISYPVKLRDLSLDSLLIFTVTDSLGNIVGGTNIHLFDEDGCLKQGKQKLIFYFNLPGDPNVITNQNQTPGELYELFSQHDTGFQMEKNLEHFYFRYGLNKLDSNKSEWLDKFLLQKYDFFSNNSSLKGEPNLDELLGRSLIESNLKRFTYLVIELPILQYPVIYEEKLYPSVEPHNPPSSLSAVLSSCIIENDEHSIEFSLIGRQFNPSWLTIVADWDMDQENLAEELNKRLSHNVRRGNADSTIKPNKEEKIRIDKILNTIGNQMSLEDMDFLYRFRYSLTENKKALIKFLYAVNWDDDNEVTELPILFSLWKEKSPIDVADALKLLSKEKSFEHPFVREFAVEVLRSASDEELLTFLLQLVQALRYEPNTTSTTQVRLASTQDFPSTKSTTSFKKISPQQNTFSSSAVNIENYNNIDATAGSVDGYSPLANFLVERACVSTTIANYFYWYLKVETEDAVDGAFYARIFEFFMSQLSSTIPEISTFFKKLLALDDYIGKIISCHREAREEGRKREGKEQILIKLLEETKLESLSQAIEWVPMPLDPSIKLSGLVPKTASMFASAVYPCVIEFKEYLPEPPSEDMPSKTHKIMFKSGDDLRQDQLIMQMISLMDSLLKKVNLDLKLLTYGILAVGQRDGIMEFVRNSMPVSAVTKNYGTITEYLRVNNPVKENPNELSPVILDTFIRSCAGYCVITYILGIGDRHLDNIMITKQGQLFHIDFGFIFGQDPKPFPPPFRFTRSMADVMGGEDSEHYSRFKTFCCQAYNWLRKSANLILNLLSLMGDAGIQDISKRSDLPKVLLKVEEKFRLDLTDEQAEQYFLALINESLHSIAPKIMEVAHKIAVSLR